MASLNIPYPDGLAGSTSDTYSAVKELFTGDTPISTIHADVLAATVDSAALPRLSVVGRDSGTGKLVKATWNATPASAILPCGITVDEVLQDATDLKVEIFKTGMFNPAMLVWDATFDTDAKKATAFELSRAPGIFIKSKLTWGVV